MACANPINLVEEEKKFFESGCLVNPVFRYKNEEQVEKFMKQFKAKPNSEFLKQSIRILKAFNKKFGSEKKYLNLEGKILTIEETEQYVNNYIKDLGVEGFITINFSPNLIAPTSVTHDPKTKLSKINIKLPVEY